MKIKIIIVFCLFFFKNINIFSQDPFITTWKTDNPGSSCNSCITIPTNGGGYNYDVDWNDDGVYDQIGLTGNVTHNFGVPGTYTIRIKGQFPQISFNFSSDNDKLLLINQWGDIQWQTMESAFLNCSNLNISAADIPNLSNVLSLYNMFASCTSLNANLNNWDVSNVTNMSFMFSNASSFNQPIGNWNVSNVTNMEFMFGGAISFNQPIGNWNVSSVSNMSVMFQSALLFNQPLENWDVSNVTDMSYMFAFAEAFNQPLENWDVSNVTNMLYMFRGARLFNHPLNSWDVSNVTNMHQMFSDANSFNHSLQNWNVANVTNMSEMFYNFYQNLSNFNQNLGNWQLNANVNLENMLHNSNLSCKNYSSTLVGWSNNLNSPSNRVIGVQSLVFGTNAQTARDHLINIKGWTIIGDTPSNIDCSPLPFITTWKTDNPGSSCNSCITIPTFSNGYNYEVDWNNDGIYDQFNLTGDITHDFGTPGTYTIRIRGDFPRIAFFKANSDREKIISINQWGDIEWQSMAGAFKGCSNLGYSAIDNPDLSDVIECEAMFQDCSIFNGNISSWDVSTVQEMKLMFFGATVFNQPLGIWNVSNVVNADWMFKNATSFNQNLTNWNISNVVHMNEMFYNASSFNQNLGYWNLNNNVSITNMLSLSGLSCINYDLTLLGWANISNIPINRNLGSLGLYYTSAGSPGRDYLINSKGWTITGDNFTPCCNNISQYQQLVSFYNSTVGPNWTNDTGWLTNCDPCGLEPGNDPWFGLTCNAVGQVTDINLPNNNLSGTLPTSLSGLTALESLKLRNNNVSGTINNNLLNGLSSFEYLDLGENDFGGLVGFPPVSIPLPSFPSSVPIKYLYLDNNNFLTTIPTIYGTYSNLLVLNLSGNTLVGNVPDNLGLLPNLYNLSLNHNELSGPIPSTFGNLASHIGVLRLQENNLSGCFDDNLHSLCNIPTILQSHINPGNSFDMEWDDFCDLNTANCQNPDVPILLSLYNSTNGANWTNKAGWEDGAAGSNCDPCGLICGNDRWHGITCNLNGQVTKIELGSNNLTGTLPNNIQNITTLTTLDLNSNSLSGVLPSDLGIENIDVLNLTFNNFTGTIPSNYFTFQYLALSNNHLTGSIPNSFATSTSLDYIFLNDNDLCGCYDPSLDALCTSTNNASNLTISNGNNFNSPWDAFCTGTGIGQCGSTQLDCYHPDFDALESFYNALDGDNWNNNSFWLSNCDPCGACPGNTKWHGITCINNRVTSIVLPNNNLTGSLPANLTDLTELRALVVNSSSITSPNNISGQLPPSYGDFEDLITFNVSGNALTGSIPNSYCSLVNTLNLINLSNNALSGCYDQVLSCLCNVNVVNISTGNNFPIPFSAFCATGDGDCSDNCIDVDGVNDYLHRSNLGTSGDFSVSAWFNAGTMGNGGVEDRICAFGPGTTTRYEVGIQETSGRLWIYDGQSSNTSGVAFGTNSLRDGQWHHIVITKSNLLNTVYLDGLSIGTFSSNTSNSYGTNFRVGNWTGGGSTTYFSGKVDDVGIWNYAMSASDIAGLISCELNGGENGLVAFWDFNVGISAANNTLIMTIPDRTTNGNDLSIFNIAMNDAASNLVFSTTGVYSNCNLCFSGPIAGVISGNETLCYNGNPSVITNTTSGSSTNGSTISYVWESSISPFNTWNVINGAISDTYDPPNGITQTTHYRRKTKSTLNGLECLSQASNVVMITVIPIVDPGLIAADQVICFDGDPAELTNLASGSVSGGATLSYQWKKSTLSVPDFVDIIGATQSTYDPPSGIIEVTRYIRHAVASLNGQSCEEIYGSNDVFINVQPEITPGAISGDQDICNNTNPNMINNAISGMGSNNAMISYIWEQSVSPFTTWTVINDEINSTYDPPSGITETTHFRRITKSTLAGVECYSIPSNVVILTFTNAPPVAQCNTGLTFHLIPSVGMISVNISQIDNGSYATCGSIASLSFHPTNLVTSLTYNCTQLGVKNEVLYVTDANGMQSSCTTTFTVDVNDPSFQALRQFYDATGGPGWTNTIANIRPWFVNCDPCGLEPGNDPWFGLTCNILSTLDNIKIKQLFVNNNNLTGTLPDVFNAFDVIEWFLVNNNPNLTGAIPPSFCSMNTLLFISFANSGIGMGAPSPTIPTNCFLDFDELVSLTVWHNTMGHFSGPLPEINPDAPISTLLFNNNNFSGTIPESYGQIELPSNGIFRFHNNPLINGCYPPSLNNHCGLVEFTNANISANTGLTPWSDFCATQSNACCQTGSDLIIDWSPIVSGTYKSSGNIQIIHPNPVIQPNANIIFSHGVGSSVTIPANFYTPPGSVTIQANGCN